MRIVAFCAVFVDALDGWWVWFCLACVIVISENVKPDSVRVNWNRVWWR